LFASPIWRFQYHEQSRLVRDLEVWSARFHVD
jgi:hypothetical protein